MAVSDHPLLAGLDAAQREAVTTDAAPLAVLAAAGSGKTRVLTRRIAWRIAQGQADGDHVLATTFTRQAAGELVGRLRALGIRDRLTVGTFHAVAWNVLRQRWDDQGRRPPELLTDRARLVAEVVGTAGRSGSGDVAVVAGEIDWAKARLLVPDTYGPAAAAAGRRTRIAPAAVTEFFVAYETLKRRRRLVDFDDLLVALLRELRDPGYAEIVRWRFRHLFVDEAQDLNPAQIRLVEALLGERTDLCVVGDPRQAIYGWNGADPAFLTGIAERYPGITILRLDRAYRSSEAITYAARAVLGDDPQPADGGTGPTGGPAPTVHGFADEQAEAHGVARLAREAGVGRSWSQIAVLARTNAQLPTLRAALAAARIPVAAPGAWLDHPAVRRALDDAAEAESVPSWLGDLTTSLHDPDLDPADAVPLEELVRRVAGLVATGALTDLRWVRAALWEESDEGVEVLTFHAAKGREWPVVVVTGCEHGLVPHRSARTVEARAEEARLLHVAMTRAATALHLTWAQRRAGTAHRRSALLDSLDDIAPPPVPAPVPPELRPHHGYGVDRPPASADQRLREWRRRRALATGMPEQSVLSDPVLRAVAEAAPATLDALGQVAGLGRVALTTLGPSLLNAVAGSVSAPSDDRPQRPAG